MLIQNALLIHKLFDELENIGPGSRNDLLRRFGDFTPSTIKAFGYLKYPSFVKVHFLDPGACWDKIFGEANHHQIPPLYLKENQVLVQFQG